MLCYVSPRAVPLSRYPLLPLRDEREITCSDEGSWKRSCVFLWPFIGGPVERRWSSFGHHYPQIPFGPERENAGGPRDTGPRSPDVHVPIDLSSEGSWVQLSASPGSHTSGLLAPTHPKLNAAKVTLTPALIPWEILLDQSPKMPRNQLMFLMNSI